VKRILPFALCLLAFGCSDAGKRVDELQAKINEQNVKIAQLQKEVDGKSAQLRALDVKIAEVQKYARQVGTTQKEGMRLQRSHQQQIDTLRDDLAEFQQKAVAPPATAVTTSAPPAAAAPAPVQAYTAPISVYSQPDPAASEFIQPPAETNRDLFPVAIIDVRGAQVVSGSYTTTQSVTTDETYEDDFGETQYRTKLEEVTVPEYDYQVSYTVQNLTRVPKQLAVGAGRKTKTVALQPGETLTNVVESALGADLTVRVGGTVRRFPVTYDE